MKGKLVGFVTLFAVLIIAVVLATSRRSSAQTPNPPAAPPAAPLTYTYKIEQAGGRLKDLEQRLNDHARNGWRISRVVAKGPSDNTLVVILEKPAGTP